MINTKCYVCGGLDHHEVAHQTFVDPYLALIDPKLNDKPRSIVVCESCGFVFHSPMLTDAEVGILFARYRDTGFRKETPDEYFDRITGLPQSESLNYKKVQKLNALLAEYGTPKKNRAIYDVGAGGGVFLKSFLDHAEGKWTAYGVEPTKSYAELAARRLGVPVKNQFYEPGLFGRRFDLITAIKVAEHTMDPISFLKGISQDLEDDGLLYVEVPNMKEIFTLPPDHDQLQYTHLYFFSDKIFEHFCKVAGYQILWKEQPTLPAGDWDLNVLLKKTNQWEGYSPKMPLYDYREILGMRRPR